MHIISQGTLEGTGPSSNWPFDMKICSLMAFEAKLLLLIATLPFWDLQAETEPEIHVGELKIKSQNEHRRLKREQFCQVLCLPNWFLYNYTCYRASTATHTWIQSELLCQQLVPGGHLASLHSLETNRFLVTLARNKLSSYVTWVGASDKYKPGTFFWTDGSPWDYSNWKHYPAVNDVHYCVELNIRHIFTKWKSNIVQKENISFVSTSLTLRNLLL